MSRPMDTSEKAERVQIELWRKMTPEQKLRLGREWTVGMQRVAFVALRQRYPDAPDDELWLRLAARRFPRELIRKIYGRDYPPS